jgi:protein-disulfide isomerase
MIKMSMAIAGLTFAALLLAASGAQVQDESAFTAAQEKRLQELVRAYLLENPEVIADAAQVLRERQAAEQAARVARALQEHRDELLGDPASPVGGNPDGTVTVVEFFDYNCPHCRRVRPVLAEMLEANPDVRFVYKDFPNLADTSRFAAEAALAARRQGTDLYLAFHDALMRADSRLTEEGVIGAARQAGVDVERMRADMAAPEIEQSIGRNIRLAKAIGVDGTPTFIVGDDMLRGFQTRAQMESAVERARPVR